MEAGFVGERVKEKMAVTKTGSVQTDGPLRG